MSTKLEIEKKWIIDFSKSWIDIAILFDGLIEIRRISQTYLKPVKKGDQSVRMRKTVSGFGKDLKTEFHYNKKTPKSIGVSKEEEYKITEEHYNKCLKHKDKNLVEIEKTRYVISYKGQILELDIFKGPLKGLCILEIELKNIKDKIKLPPTLKIIKEVTNDKSYSNYDLANKSLHKNLKLHEIKTIK